MIKSGLTGEMEVAPRAGAWIEIYGLLINEAYESTSHPVRVRGLKYLIALVFQHKLQSRTPCGCVD